MQIQTVLTASRRRKAPAAAVVLATLILTAACGGASELAPLPAPGFSLESLDGAPVSLADFAGSIVVLNFWATWCQPCRVEMPDLTDLYRTYKADGVVVVGMAVSGGSRDAVQAFAAELDIPYPILLSTESVEASYNIELLPTSALIDRQGRLRQVLLGYHSHRELTGAVERLLAEDAVSVATRGAP
ncbi:MAG: TlpA family protein disulfide reductase [Candidatus Schekmanbacteria bacterium]|nr:TlpA family protein disulfide reductase [Candidatus Schekmanbacteria bacterium]